MNKAYKYVIAVIVLVILVAGLAQAGNDNSAVIGTVKKNDDNQMVKSNVVKSYPKTNVKVAHEEKTNNAIVRYTQNGFVPFFTEVKAGTTVTFVSESNSMRISSKPFGNSNLPEIAGFNQNQTVGKGGTFSFTFNDRGTWSYYNLNNPQHKGLILVK